MAQSHLYIWRADEKSLAPCLRCQDKPICLLVKEKRQPAQNAVNKNQSDQPRVFEELRESAGFALIRAKIDSWADRRVR